MKNTFLPKTFLLAILLFGGKLFAQGPNISYPTAQVYTVGTPISVAPVNGGGPVVYGTVSTLAGTAGTSGNTNNTGTAATFNGPQNTVTDASGNLYVVDYDNNNIRKITPAGVVTTFAGSLTGASGNSNTGTGLFNGPNGITIDAAGTLYISDQNNNSIRTVTAAGVVAILATGLRGPAGLCFDAAGTTLYVAEQSGHHIRKVVKSTGAVSNWSGSTTSTSGFANGNLANTRYNSPVDVAFDASGNLFVMDYSNHAIRKLTAAGASTTFAGGGTGPTPVSGYSDATGTAARFRSPYGMTIDVGGNIYVGDYGNNVIRKVTTAGVVTTFAGTQTTTPGAITNGTLTTATFNGPLDMHITPAGIMYLADYGSHTIRKILLSGYNINPAALPAGLSFDNTTGIISGTPTTVTAAATYTITAYNYSGTINITVAAPPSLGSYAGSPYTFPISKAMTALPNTNTGGTVPANVYGTVSALATGLGGPTGINTTSDGTIFYADKTNNRIRKILAGVTSTVAGSTTAGSGNGTGTAAGFNLPSDVTTDGAGNLYVADLGNHQIRKIVLATATVTTFAGSTSGYTDATGGSAKFNAPSGLTCDALGNIYVADQGNNVIRKITPAGEVTTFAGVGAGLSSPASVVMDASGNVYVADKGNRKIRKITPAGVVTTFAGTGTAGSTDGSSTVATFTAPNGITIDRAGNLYVSDGGSTTSHKIRRISPSGVVSTVAGAATTGTTNGVGIIAKFNTPAGLSVNPINGNILVADAGNNRIREIIGTGYTISPTLPTGLVFSTAGALSGTPTVPSPATDYTVTAFNIAGSSSTIINITTEFTEPDISYTTPVSFLAGTALGVAPNTAPTLTNNGSPVGSTIHTSTAVTGGTLSGSFGMARDISGNIYVANYTNNTISKYNSSGVSQGAFGTNTVALINPTAIVFDSGGNYYVLNYNGGAGRVYKYSSSGIQQSTNFTSNVLQTSYGMAIDASDNIYITNYSGTNNTTFKIYKYNTSGTLLATMAATTINQPTNVTADASGNLYVTNLAGNSVYKYTVGTGIFSSFVTGLTGPYGINIDAIGNIYVGDTGNGSVKIYNSAGTLITSFNNATPRGLVIDGQQNVFVSSFGGNTVTKWVRTGGFFSNKPLPTGLALNTATGAISGTPTTSTPAADYTITAYNTTGGGSTVINITVYQVKSWVGNGGAQAGDWNAAVNWTGGVPTPADRASFNGNYSSLPTVSIPTKVGSIIFGTPTGGTASTITVNSTLTVSGDIIYQGDANSWRSTNTATINGTGVVSATNLNILANVAAGTNSYNLPVISSVDSLKLSGNIAITSSKSGIYTLNSTFNVTGGKTVVAGGIKATNAAGSTSAINVTGGTLAVGGPIQTTNNATGVTSISVSNATLKLADPDPLSGFTANNLNANTLTLGTGSTVEYSGTNQTVYSDSTLVGQPAGLNYKNITFSGSGIKDVASGNLNINGDFTDKLTSNNTTSYVDFSSSTVQFNGTNQALKAGDGLGTTLYNTLFSGGGTKTMSGTGTGVFSLASSGIFTLSGSSTLASGGALTLKSDANSSATIAAIPTGSSITGNVIAQRFITGNQDITYRGYRLLSSPVGVSTGPTATYYNLNFLQGSGTYISGAAGGVGLGGFDVSGNPTLYLYREDRAPSAIFASGNYSPITKINNTPNSYLLSLGAEGDFNMPVGNGFLFFFRGNPGTVSTTLPNDITLNLTGTINQGQVIVKHWVTQTPNLLFTTQPGGVNAAIQGFNLVGNPYPSSIDWDKYSASVSSSPIYAPNTDGNIYVLDPISKNYGIYQAGSGIEGTHGVTNVIPAGQGFFVRATGAAQLIFNESAKVNDQVNGPNLLLGTPVTTNINKQYMRVQLAKDAVNTDDILIRFNPGTSANFVTNEDARYQKGNGIVSLASVSTNNVALTINQMPLPKQSQVIPLKITATSSGIYTLNVNEIKDLPELYDIWLKDAYKNDSLDVKHNTTYTFNIAISDTSSYGSKRFSLVLRQNPAYAYRLLDFSGTKQSQQVELAWQTENEANYTYFTVERSLDGGKSFEVLNSVPAKSMGNYSTLDKFPAKGENQYRLKQEDLNGVVSYSKVVSIMYTFVNNSIINEPVSVYPNPASSSINLVINKAITAGAAYNITITNSTGRTVRSVLSSQPTWQGDVSRLLPGTYYIQVVNERDKTVVGRNSFIKL